METHAQRQLIALLVWCVTKACVQTVFARASTMANAVAVKCAVEALANPSSMNVRVLGIVARAWCAVRVNAAHRKWATRVSAIKTVAHRCTAPNHVLNALN